MDEDKLDISSKIASWAITNVKYIAFGAIIGVSIPLFWNYQEHKKEEANIAASDLYYELINLANTPEETQTIADEMFNQHGGSIYETLTKFILSKKEFETKNFDLAKKYLEEIIESDSNEAYISLALIKISLIQIENKNYDEALFILDQVKMKDSFKQIISEIKGDIYNFKGNKKESLKFYNDALEASAVDNENLMMKRNSVED